jgi:hypothetical protein
MSLSRSSRNFCSSFRVSKIAISPINRFSENSSRRGACAEIVRRQVGEVQEREGFSQSGQKGGAGSRYDILGLHDLWCAVWHFLRDEFGKLIVSRLFEGCSLQHIGELRCSAKEYQTVAPRLVFPHALQRGIEARWDVSAVPS